MRRVEAVTGPAVLAMIDNLRATIADAAAAMKTVPGDLVRKAGQLNADLSAANKEIERMAAAAVQTKVDAALANPADLGGVGFACVTLKDTGIDTVRKIGENTFECCYNMAEIEIPSSVTNIGQFAFASCSLSEVNLNEGLISIGYGAFEYNYNLCSIVIPSTVKRMESSVFFGCNQLTSVFFAGNAPEYADSYVYNGTPVGLTTFVRSGSTGWAEAGSTELPEQWPTSGSDQRPIREWTTYPDLGWMVRFDLGEGAVRAGGGELEQMVRDGQSAVEPVLALNSGYEFVEWNQPFDCVTNGLSVAAIYRKDGKLVDGKNYTETVGDYTWTFSVANGEAIIGVVDEYGNPQGQRAVEPNPQGALTIPATLGGCPVVEVGYYALFNSGITSATLPETVRTIGGLAFESCFNLAQVEIPAATTEIGEYAFRYCSQLRNLTVDSGNLHYTAEDGVLYDRGKTAIYFWPQQKAIEIPSGVRDIGPYAFYNNYASQYQSVTLPSSVTNIGQYAFAYCYLSEVNLNEGLVSI